MPNDFAEFVPHPFLKSGHAQTIAGAFLRRKFVLPAGAERLFRVDGSTQLRGVCHWQPGQSRHLPAIVVVHGLEGSCDSDYARGIADKAWACGFHSIRLNQRNCGGTERLTPTLYNSGLSNDYRAVLYELIDEGFQNIFFAGYSMGGNLVSKMAGEFGPSAPPQLRGVAAVCPAIDLSRCADALEERQNYLYQWHFVRALMKRYRRKCALFPQTYSHNGLPPIRTVREFDDFVTAPYFGFRDAEEYYECASAKKVIANVGIPLLLITAQDDPFVPYVSFLAARVADNSRIQFIAPDHGGHCGFVSRWSGPARFWAEQSILNFVHNLM
jgi:hypothetical protein